MNDNAFELQWRKDRLKRQLQELIERENEIDEQLRPLQMKLDRIRDEKAEVLADLCWIENNQGRMERHAASA